MIIPDVNLLLYAEIAAFDHHPAARRWWEDALNGDRQVGLAPVCLFAFLRIGTNRRIFETPLEVADAAARIRAWLEQPNAVLLQAGPEHLEISLRLVEAAGTGGNLTTDAQIAAHAVDVNGEVHSNDTDFARFEGVRWSNPLA